MNSSPCPLLSIEDPPPPNHHGLTIINFKDQQSANLVKKEMQSLSSNNCVQNLTCLLMSKKIVEALPKEKLPPTPLTAQGLHQYISQYKHSVISRHLEEHQSALSITAEYYPQLRDGPMSRSNAEGRKCLTFQATRTWAMKVHFGRQTIFLIEEL